MATSGGFFRRFNVDGWLTWQPDSISSNGAASYSQLFFDGRIEAVVAGIVHRRVSRKLRYTACVLGCASRADSDSCL
jgi:hypothetical protein